MFRVVADLECLCNTWAGDHKNFMRRQYQINKSNEINYTDIPAEKKKTYYFAVAVQDKVRTKSPDVEARATGSAVTDTHSDHAAIIEIY
jgi:hypothetical protein